MRVRRSVPQKPLTGEQKQRALEAQKNVTKFQGPLTASQMYQTQQSPISNSGRGYPFNTMNRSFMMDKKATFEEKYGVYENKGTTIELGAMPEIEEDLTVPPSLEEDPNQSSPLPPDVQNASDEDALDKFIKDAEATQEKGVIEFGQEKPKVSSIDIQILQDELNQLSVKQLKEEYKSRGGERNIEFNNSKKSIINLITELYINGTQQKETTGQDGSAD